MKSTKRRKRRKEEAGRCILMTSEEFLAELSIAVMRLQDARKRLERRQGALTPGIRERLDEVKSSLSAILSGQTSTLAREILERQKNSVNFKDRDEVKYGSLR